jgi:hypothetical protein
MKGDPPLPLSGKTPEERFNELGSRLMAVSKTEIVALEKKWHAQKRRRGSSKKTRR